MYNLFNNRSKSQQGKRMRWTCRLQVEQLETREVLSTSASSYLVPTGTHVSFTPIITVGDTVPQADGATNGVPGAYRMVGIPDGLGAFDNGDGTFTVLMHHELPNTSGIVRDHGSKGAFVSRYVIDKATLNVISGDDLIKQIMLFDPTANGGAGGYVPATTALNRICSADLPAVSALFNAGLGTTERIFMSGEETAGGR